MFFTTTLSVSVDAVADNNDKTVAEVEEGGRGDAAPRLCPVVVMLPCPLEPETRPPTYFPTVSPTKAPSKMPSSTPYNISPRQQCLQDCKTADKPKKCKQKCREDYPKEEDLFN